MMERHLLIPATVCLVVLTVVALLSVVQATQINCNTQASLSPESNLYPFSTSTNFAPPVACSINAAGALLITAAANQQTSSAGYLNRAFRIVNGFRATFNFIVNSGLTAEGFAFVIQKQSLQIVGGSSANLGYNFANNIAIEFDMFTDTTIVDTPGGNHVEVHTVYTGANSADNNVAKLPTASSNPGVDMSDGQTHSVVINYIPASSVSGASGQITVQIDSGTLLTTLINSDSVAAMFANGIAYVGFTGSTSSSVASDVLISNFAFSTVPVDPTQTYVIGSALSSGRSAANAKSATAQGTVQLVDKCGSALPISYGNLITAVVTTDGTTTSPNGGSAVTDLANGQYGIYWWNSVAAIPSTTLQLVIKYNGVAIKSSPYAVLVVPGAPNAPSCSVSPSVPSSFTAGVAQTVTVTLKDVLGNPTALPSGYYISAGFQSSYDTINSYTTAISGQPSQFNVPLASNTAQSSVSVLIRVHNPSVSPDVDIVAPKTVSVVAGTASGAKSALAGNGLAIATAHTTASITLSVNDAYSNPVNTNTGVTVTGQLLTTKTSGGPAPVALSAVYNSGNTWTLTYSTDVAGYYTISVLVNSVSVPTTGSPYVQPSSVSRGDILSVISNATAATSNTFTIQAYDGYSNARTSANDAGKDFTVGISAGAYSTTIGCTTTSTPATNAYISAFSCTYLLSGQYQVSITPLKSVKYTVSLSVNTVGASTLTYSTFYVTAGSPNAAQSTVQNLPATSVAGIASTFQLTIRDANGNVRTGVDDRGFLSQYQLTTSAGSVFATISAVTPDFAGNYAFTYTATLAGVYTSVVKVSSVNVPTASPTTNVVPGALAPTQSQLSGQGLIGGVGGQSATFVLQARDAFQNNLLVSSNTVNVFYPSTTDYLGNVVQGLNCTPDGSKGGYYTCTYTVPVYAAGHEQYTLNVYVTAGTVLAATYTPTANQNPSISNAITNLINGVNTAVAGAPTTFTITDRDQQNPPQTPTTSQTIFSVTFTPNFANAPASTIGLPTISCPGSALQTCNPKTVTYTPYIAGTYTVRIYASQQETVESKANNFQLTITPGAASPLSTILSATSGSTVVAGTSFSFTAYLADAQGNKILQGGAASSITFSASVVFSAPTIADNNDGSYLITTTFYLAGQQQIVPLVNGALTNGLSVTVTAGSVSGTKSVVSTIQSPVTVGSPSSIISVTLADQYNNPIGNAQPCQVTLTNNPNMTQTFVSTGGNVYLMTFTPVVSDYNSLFNAAVVCNGVTLSNPSSIQQVQIIPASVDGTQSAIIGLDTGGFVAGTPIKFLLQLKDSLGNPWRTFRQPVTSPSRDSLEMTALYSATIAYNPARSITAGATLIAHDDSQPGAGVYVVTFTPQYSSPGNYSFVFTADGLSYVPAVGLQTIFIAPGAPSLKNTLLPIGGLKNDYSKGNYYDAGSSFDVVIHLRDIYQNPIATGGLASQLLVIFYDKYTSSYCLQGRKDISAPAQSNFTGSANQIVDNNDGSYTITIQTTVAGQFWFDIVYAGQTLITDSNCVSIPDMTAFTVAPLDADAAHTKLSPIFGGRAGDVMSFDVTLYDQYDNMVLRNNHTITTGLAALCTSNPNNYPALTLDTSGGYVTGPVGAVFTVTFQVNTSSHYVVPILMDGVLATAVAGECPVVFVRPAYIAAVTFTTTSAITAGLPNQLILETADRFGNPVFSDASTSTIPVFSATFSRATGAAYVVTSQSIYTGAHSYPLVPIAFEADGLMNVDVVLPADPLDPTSFTQQFTTTIVVSSAACARIDPTKPYRCPDTRTCVSSYSDCTGFVACQGFICPNTTMCVTSFSQCDTTNICTNGTIFCETGINSGYCTLPQSGTGGTNESVAISACPEGTQDSFCLYQGLVNCGQGICRASLADCPSQRVCPPFTFICPDGSSCASDVSNCPPLPQAACAAPYPFQCRDGHCVGRAEDCGTEKTCTNGQFLCPDGSCKSDASYCRETFTCLFGLVKCSNGECRQRLQDCPTSLTCPPGQVLCENGGCRANALACDSNTPQCPNGVRCADGTCRPNQLQCPTLITCTPEFPVLCSDHSCVRDVSQCPTPRVCPTNAPYLCPDGSCTMYNTTCPTTVSCPKAMPTLCPDGTCVDIVDNCPQTFPPSTCPPHRPYRCADGSCVGSWSYCPTKQVKCFDYAPVLCPDHRCVSSVEMCVTAGLVQCPTGQIRCPNGGCAWSRALCPTQVTCGLGYVRGTDGSCKLETLLSGNASTIGAFTAGASPACPASQVICPQNHQGYSCADRLSDCPQDITCPRDRPIRCFDASCAMSYEDCPPVVTITGATIICPGAATTSSGVCGASTTCPPYAPTKCWDESCRILPEDCPPQAKCDSVNYFLCSNGQCTSSPLGCTSGQKCNLGGNNVKCPWAMAGVSQCVTNVTACANLFDDYPERTCPDSYSRCRDGYCSLDSSRCSFLSCPTHIPFICPNGGCARSADECDLANGCPFDEPVKCTDGSCVTDSTLCPDISALSCPGNNVTRCNDGSCPDINNPCVTNSTGCVAGAQLCADGFCATNPSDCFDATDKFNACPAYRPYRCADGFCAKSSYLCPIVPLPFTLAAPKTSGKLIKSVRCADGSQVAFGAQCPTIRPCPGKQVRCPNGQCRGSLTLCPLSDPCSLLFPASSAGPAGVRCSTGYCATSLAACADEKTGCPDVAPYKCSNGQCVTGPTVCPADLPLLAQPANGCPSATPFKCFDGSCNADITACPASNGCPAVTPQLCATGECLPTGALCPNATATGPTTPCTSGVRCPNGQCQASWSSCAMLNGCPVASPVRCANGDCKKYPARAGDASVDACQPTVTCDALNPFLCFDQTCVSNPIFCRSVLPCPVTAPILCPGFLCQTLANGTCPTSVQCPARSPVLCPDGACKTSVAQCSSVIAARTCPVGQIRCFDGVCRSKPLDCAAAAFQNYQTGTFSNTGNHQNSTCASPDLTLCPDGTCVPLATQCSFVSACPASLPLRCPDGACINATTSSCAAIGSCSSPYKRCEDGLCRTTCLKFEGCPSTTPYACTGRKIACTVDQATCVSGSNFAHRRRLFAVGDSSTSAGQEACTDCQSQIPATSQTVQVLGNADQTIDVSVDAASVPRTQLYLPAGVFGGAVNSITISPVPTSGLSFDTSPTSQSSIAAGPFLFSTNVLSTPFTFTLDNPNAPLLGGVTVFAAIDNMIYDAYAPTGNEAQKTVPCEIQGPTYTVTPDASVYVPGGTKQYACSGSLSLSSTDMSFSMDPSCESISISGTYVGQGGAVVQPWDGTSSSSCDCFNITSSSTASPSPLPPYSPKNHTGQWQRYSVNNLVCFFITRTQTQFSMAVYTDPTRAGHVCPFLPGGKESNALYYTMSRTDNTDGCGGSGVGGNRIMNPNDICLASVDSTLGTWSCLQPDRTQRLLNPTWYAGSGRPQNRVSGTVTVSPNGAVVAFAYIPLPPAPVPEEPTCNLWCQYKAVILGVVIGFACFFLCMGYILSRFKRYRDKYREQKARVEELTEIRRDLDENYGGVGVADEEVDMMANPMVIEMKKLDEQLNKVNLEMNTQAEKDSRTIEQLSQDRERLHAEIQRVKTQMAAQQKTSATRLEDVAPVMMPPPVPVSSTSGLTPMEMESGPTSGDTSSSGDVIGQERHEFAQVRRPAKKKDDL